MSKPSTSRATSKLWPYMATADHGVCNQMTWLAGLIYAKAFCKQFLMVKLPLISFY
jgi:hypothetical protein